MRYILTESQLLRLMKGGLREAPSASDKIMGDNGIKIPRDGAHAGQSGWQSNNAWDIKADIGDPVYAVAPGRVITFKDYGPSVIKRDGKKLFGAGFTVKSDDGFPSVYYTHLKDPKVSKGDKIECGQLLGFVMDFPGSSYDHLHIGVESGHNIRELINDDGTIKCGGNMDLNKVNIGNIQPSDDEDMGDDSEKESRGVGYGSLFKLK
jgi:murein DD-endopeptidase MepM/ murein hydrolase activator NlpD